MENEWTKQIEDLRDANQKMRDMIDRQERQLDAADKTIVELRRDRDYLRSIVDMVGGRG